MEKQKLLPRFHIDYGQANYLKKYGKLKLEEQEEIYNDVINKLCHKHSNYDLKLYVHHKYSVKINTATIWGWIHRNAKPLDNVKRWQEYNRINNVINPPLRNKKTLEKALHTKLINRKKFEDAYFQITDDKQQILLGSLLGDGYLGINKRAKNAYYREAHCMEQKKYLLWKNNFLNFKIREYKIFLRTRNRWQIGCVITSRCFTYLTKLYKIFYCCNKKVVTNEILSMLRPLGIAVWYMDDGYYNYRDSKILLCTDGFTLAEQYMIKDWFKTEYDIIWKINKIRNQYRLITDDIEKFVRLIKQYIIPTMIYKIGLDDDKRREIKRKKMEYNKRYYALKKYNINLPVL